MHIASHDQHLRSAQNPSGPMFLHGQQASERSEAGDLQLPVACMVASFLCLARPHRRQLSGQAVPENKA